MTHPAKWHAEAIRMIDEGATYRAVAERYGVTVQAAVSAVNYSATARGISQVSDEERAARREDQLRKRRDRERRAYRLAHGLDPDAPVRRYPDADERLATRRQKMREYAKKRREAKKVLASQNAMG